jgi:hypothetical protein
VAERRQDRDLVRVLHHAALVAGLAAGDDLDRDHLAAPQAAEHAREAALADLGGQLEVSQVSALRGAWADE